jgi:two-component sensor histidine kinase
LIGSLVMPVNLLPEVSELEALLSSEESAMVVDALLGSIPSGVTIASAPSARIVRFSDYAAQLLGRPRSTVEGLTFPEAWNSQPAYDASGRFLPVDQRPLMRALRGDTVIAEVSKRSADGEQIPCLCNAAPIRNPRGDLIGAISAFADLRAHKALERGLREALAREKEALAQREALYQELTHRVKNHLQILTALVAMNARSDTLTTQEVCDRVTGQLQTLAAVYRGMDRAGVGERIEARRLLDDVSRPYASGAVSVDVAVAPPDLTLAAEQTGPLSMLVNEAVCNSYKHAFDQHSGRIQVSLRRVAPGRLRLEVADDGKGWAFKPGHVSHGLDLMKMFATQLQGDLQLGDSSHGGALVATELPENAG